MLPIHVLAVPTTGRRRMPTKDRALVLLASDSGTAELRLDRGKRHPDEYGVVRVVESVQLRRWVSWLSCRLWAVSLVRGRPVP